MSEEKVMLLSRAYGTPHKDRQYDTYIKDERRSSYEMSQDLTCHVNEREKVKQFLCTLERIACKYMKVRYDYEYSVNSNAFGVSYDRPEIPSIHHQIMSVYS